MATKPGALYDFPWAEWGSMKYAVFLPFVATVALGKDDGDSLLLALVGDRGAAIRAARNFG